MTKEDFNTWQILKQLPARTAQYRIPERDFRKGNKLIYKHGDYIQFNRVVARVGYEIDKHSVSKADWYATGVNIITRETGVDKEIVEKVIMSLRLSSPFRMKRSQIYYELVKPLTESAKESEHYGIRGMWFVDVDEAHGIIEGRVRRLTGTYHPVETYYGCDGPEYGPAWLSSYNQNLYAVNSNYGSVLVHPDDIIQSE